MFNPDGSVFEQLEFDRIDQAVAKFKQIRLNQYNELVDRKRSIDYNKKSISGLYAKNVVRFMREILDEIKQLDPEKYMSLEEKYGNELKAYSFVPDDKFTQDFMYDVGDYIVRKTNTEIRGDQFKDAIREVYKVTKPELSPEELEKELEKKIISIINEKYKSVGENPNEICTDQEFIDWRFQ